MHYTFHLTNQCTMRCDYCYVDGIIPQNMSLETAKMGVDFAVSCHEPSTSIGIVFFGGEPLLQRDLIENIVEYCKAVMERTGQLFHFKITTNGTLLDMDFIEFSMENNIFIALSHDGVAPAHDRHRVSHDRSGTFDKLSDKIDLLLSNRPYSPVMMTVNPDTVTYYSQSVEYLYSKGFKYLICSLNYAGDWDKNAFSQLEHEYKKLAAFYFDKTMREEKFYLSPFEVKISSHIHRKTYCRERCELGKKQISIAPDGTLYPCVQFVGREKFKMGHVQTGINETKQQLIYLQNEEDKGECKECAIRNRCHHTCGCLNIQSTGSIDTVSPVLCAHERILLPIVDKLAEKLYKKRNGMFIQKHYNEMYPVLSIVEDRTI